MKEKILFHKNQAMEIKATNFQNFQCFFKFKNNIVYITTFLVCLMIHKMDVVSQRKRFFFFSLKE